MEQKRIQNNGDCERKITQQSRERVLLREKRRTSVSVDDIQSATVMVFGAPGTGKSALISRLVGNGRSKKHNTMEICGGGKTRYKIRFISPDFSDTQSSWSSAVESQVKQADAFLLIYAVNSRESLDRAINYREKLEDLIGSDFPVLLLSNKVDLITERVVIPAEAELRALHWDTAVLEVSAKTELGFSELKRTIFQMVDFPPRLYMPRLRVPSLVPAKLRRGVLFLTRNIFTLD